MVIVIPVFLAALLAVFVVLVLFSGAILVAVLSGQGLDSCVSFGFLFCCCFGWRFRCCFGLCFCSLGPGTRIGSCMVVSVPLSYDFGWYFLH